MTTAPLHGQSEPDVRAAGGVVWRRLNNGDIELLVIHRDRYNDWSFPKGKLRRNESALDAALREVFEETSLQVELGEQLSTTRYSLPDGRLKEVQYWECEVTVQHKIDDEHLSKQNEVAEIVWLPPARAVQLLTYSSEHDLVGELIAKIGP